MKKIILGSLLALTATNAMATQFYKNNIDNLGPAAVHNDKFHDMTCRENLKFKTDRPLFYIDEYGGTLFVEWQAEQDLPHNWGKGLNGKEEHGRANFTVTNFNTDPYKAGYSSHWTNPDGTCGVTTKNSGPKGHDKVRQGKLTKGLKLKHKWDG